MRLSEPYVTVATTTAAATAERGLSECIDHFIIDHIALPSVNESGVCLGSRRGLPQRFDPSALCLWLPSVMLSSDADCRSKPQHTPELLGD